jgi:DNA-binding MarR family transcriptional regulator
MALPTPKERALAEAAAKEGNKLAQAMIKNWDKEEAKLKRKEAKKSGS